ncbi:MAG TPA: tRNA (adenosine(37)-N6)-threonylcarbamoyltransferase complex ATPase subunit type 1 TsaE, partial [Myxococcota bacterium]|nr:tRNA (adenosine(37)-N6)-threonylcarbamoyltransferase complex ATPase subunit type 1 TsaE [Myxococcota bacterium]
MMTVDWSNGWSGETRSLRTTRKLARTLARHLGVGKVLGLVGELGAGKTSFVQGLAEGAGVHDLGQVLSPTYTLVNEYPAAMGLLVHIDFYRLKDEESARALGVDEHLGRPDALTVVEWADHLPDLMPPDAAWGRLTRLTP